MKPEERYIHRFASRPPFDPSWENNRFVVLDTESTGLDVKRDRLITIGAVAVTRGQIELEDSFEVMMPIAFNTSSVTLHGITKELAENGMPEDQALVHFLDYLQDGIIVGHHIRHDVAMLNAACERHLRMLLRNDVIDTLDLSLRLQKTGAFAGELAIEDYSLDGLCRAFNIVPHDRHTASGDAFLTAQILMRLLKKARFQGWLSVGQLTPQWQE